MDLSQFTDDELKAELGGMRLALKATLGRPYDGREEYKNADLRSKIEALSPNWTGPQCQPDLKARNVRRRDRQRRVVHIRKILIRGLCRNCAPTFFFFEWHLGRSRSPCWVSPLCDRLWHRGDRLPLLVLPSDNQSH